MTALQPREFLLYYAGVLLIALIVFMRRRPRKGMRLRLGSGRRRERVGGAETRGGNSELAGKSQAPPAKEKFSHIQPRGERPLNVMFNYNGHSWDAYEVLGLPAGSSLENAEAAYQESLTRIDNPSKPFVEAAYRAIVKQWDAYRGTGRGA